MAKPIKRKDARIPPKLDGEIQAMLADGKSGLAILDWLKEEHGITMAPSTLYDHINKMKRERQKVVDAARFAAASVAFTSEIERSKKAIDLLWSQATKSLTKGKVNEARLCLETMTKIQEKLGNFSSFSNQSNPFEDAKNELMSEIDKLIDEKKNGE